MISALYFLNERPIGRLKACVSHLKENKNEENELI